MAYALSTSSHYGAGADAMAKSIEASTGGTRCSSSPTARWAASARSSRAADRHHRPGDRFDRATLNFVPETGVFDIPFLLRDLPHARTVLDSKIGQDMLAKFPSRGIIALAWGEQGFRHLTNNVRPVKTPADAKGLKIRTTENPIHIAAFRQIGILPTPMAWPEVATALQQGTIDGQETAVGHHLGQAVANAEAPGADRPRLRPGAGADVGQRLQRPVGADKANFDKAGKESAQAMRASTTSRRPAWNS